MRLLLCLPIVGLRRRHSGARSPIQGVDKIAPERPRALREEVPVDVPVLVNDELIASGDYRMTERQRNEPRVATRPYIARLKLRNTRAISFTDKELDTLLDVLAYGRPATVLDLEVKAQPRLVPPIVFASVTGCA